MSGLSGRVVVASVAGSLVGGLLGAAAMSAGHALLSAAARDAPPPSDAAQGEDATVKVADQVSRVVRQRPLEEREKPVAAEVVHYGFGATMGALYGAVALAAPRATIGAGLGFGAAVWLGAHAVVVPALGLARSPLHEPPGKEARELVLHLIYGVTVNLVRAAAIRISR